MTCDECKSEGNVRLKLLNGSGFVCLQCHYNAQNRASFDGNRLFHVVDTVNLRLYAKNGGNVSKSRIDMIKSRRLHPEGNGEVILTRNGRITDKLSANY